MFDLETSIAEWREQMLAAGIKTPVPLEELEIHLGEEIERQMKAGGDEAEAFKIAVQQIGHGKALKSEFNKADSNRMMTWTVMLIIGWLAAGFTLLYGLFRLSFDWDFISFHPQLDGATMLGVFLILVGQAGIWFLAKASRDRASRIVSLLACLSLIGFAVVNYGAMRHPPGNSGFFWAQGSGPTLVSRRHNVTVLCAGHFLDLVGATVCSPETRFNNTLKPGDLRKLMENAADALSLFRVAWRKE